MCRHMLKVPQQLVKTLGGKYFAIQKTMWSTSLFFKFCLLILVFIWGSDLQVIPVVFKRWFFSFLLPHSLIQSFIYISMDSLLLILFCESFSNTIIIFVQIFPATATWKELFQVGSWVLFQLWLLDHANIWHIHELN